MNDVVHISSGPRTMLGVRLEKGRKGGKESARKRDGGRDRREESER